VKKWGGRKVRYTTSIHNGESPETKAGVTAMTHNHQERAST